MTTSPLTVLIPTHGRAALLGRTLDSVAACRLPASYRETVVVENGSKADTEGIVAACAATHPSLRLRYLHVARANKSYALNEALRTVTDGLAVFFDDDIRLAPGVLVAYAEAAAAHDERAYFGGPFGVDYETPPPDWLRPFLPASALGVELHGPRPVHFLGFNWAAFTADLDALGGFDPNRGPGSPTGAVGQEAEMQYRMRHAGFERVDVPGARVWHWVPRERCTPEWALDRTYKAGLQTGTRERAKGDRLRPLWVAEYAARTAAAGARWVGSTVRRDPVGQFDARTRLRKHIGALVGYTR